MHDDDMMDSVLSKMIGDTEDYTADSMKPKEMPVGNGQSVTITISGSGPKEADDEEMSDGGYADLMSKMKPSDSMPE
jgi:hypothetical protein